MVNSFDPDPITRISNQPLQGEFSNWHVPVHTNHRFSLTHRVRYFSRSQRFTNANYMCSSYREAITATCNAIIKTNYSEITFNLEPLL
ncbi:MAG: hypothetical protein CL726_03700 [Chloroflexi bacterium]|nr:hypothetical protein [Chloroflexota bacterium]